MIRPATVHDAGAIAGLQLRSWHHAYAEIVDPAMLAEHTLESRRARWAQWLDPEADAHRHTLVFVQDGPPAGFVALGDGEVSAIYVDPPAQGAGVGTALLSAAEDGLRADGCTEAFLWVLAGNGLGRRFYEARGWALVGGSERNDRWGRQVRYAREL